MKRVLVVDDEPALRRIVSQVLGEAGYDVRRATNGADALDQLAETWPDCILLDLDMPVVDGRAFLQAFRANPRAARVPVAVFTTLTDANQIARELGAQAVVAKPFDIDALTETVAGLIGRPLQGPSEQSLDIAAVTRAKAAALSQQCARTRVELTRLRTVRLRARACLARAMSHIEASTG